MLQQNRIVRLAILFSFVLLTSYADVRAQLSMGTVSSSSLMGAQGAGMSASRTVKPHFLFAPLASDIAVSYFDNTLPFVDIYGGVSYGPYLTLALGERFSLQGDFGYLDSIAVMIDTLVGDSIEVSLLGDTLYQTSQGMFHLMNIFESTVKSYGDASILGSQTHSPARVVIPFDHVWVPKAFFVSLAPSINNVTRLLTSYFSIRGDNEPTRTSTADNTRSGVVVQTQSGQTFSSIGDGFFIPAGATDPVYTNFDITIYYSAGQSSVPRDEMTASSVLSLSPNPASSYIDVAGATSKTEISILDLLGRQVLRTVSNSGKTHIALDDLSNGVYTVISRSEGTMNSRRLVITR